MKVTDLREIASVYANLGLTLDLAKKLDDTKGGQGLYRGAHQLDGHNFDTYRLDSMSHVDDGRIMYDNVVKKGQLPKGLKPVLVVSAGDLAYDVVPGEHMFVYREQTEDWLPGVMQGAVNKNNLVAGQIDGSGWQQEIDPYYCFLPVHRITSAGLVTTSAAAHFLAGVEDDTLDELADKLAAKNLTFGDVYVARSSAAADYEATKFFKRLGRKAGLTAYHDLLASLIEGSPVDLPKAVPPNRQTKVSKPVDTAPAAKAPAKAKAKAKPDTELDKALKTILSDDKPAVKAKPAGKAAVKPAPEAKPAGKAAAKPADKPATKAVAKPAAKPTKPATAQTPTVRKDIVLKHVTELKGSKFAKAYSDTCAAAGVADGDRKTARADMLEHFKKLLTVKVLNAVWPATA